MEKQEMEEKVIIEKFQINDIYRLVCLSIGVVSLLFFVFLSINFIVRIKDINANSKDPIPNNDFLANIRSVNEKQEKKLITTELSFALALFLVMILASGSLIVGIFKKRHILMLPWLSICFFILIVIVIYLLRHLIALIANDMPFGYFLYSGIKVIGVLAFSLWSIHNLYKDIRDNKAKDTKDVKVTALTTDKPTITIQKF